MTIIVDGFGGDNAPLEIIKGCAMAVEKFDDIEIVLTGDEKKINEIASNEGISMERIDVVHAPDVIEMSDHPTELMKTKKGSSMAVGLSMLAEGRGDAMISAGSTGAMLTGATLIVKRIKGVKRPALAPVMPNADGKFMLIDCGANADCRPEMLVQFAHMGSVYMKNVLGVENPRVGLANIGTEETKGDELRKAAYELLKNEPNINFIGNFETRDIAEGGVDVLVADGFTGNIILKTYEGVATMLSGKFKGVFKKNIINKLGAAVMLKDLNEIKRSMDHNEYGGAPFLGVRKPVFKAHGSSKAITICNAIRLTREFVSSNVIGKIAEDISESGQNE
ncbi:MAG: phosphate acyltransferase PlsX [Clostridia bacterium]|nr:phosphate acyltransferase PlsX [Clostridia bacterium]